MRTVRLDDSTAEAIGILLRELVQRETSAFGGTPLPETVQVTSAWEAAVNDDRPDPERIQLRWNLNEKTWEAHAVIGSAPTLVELDAEFPDSSAVKPGTGWPLDDDHPIVVASAAAIGEWDAITAVRKERHGG